MIGIDPGNTQEIRIHPFAGLITMTNGQCKKAILVSQCRMGFLVLDNSVLSFPDGETHAYFLFVKRFSFDVHSDYFFSFVIDGNSLIVDPVKISDSLCLDINANGQTE